MSALGFGSAPIGNLYSAVDEDTAHATVLEAIRLGVRHFDTAPYYGLGLAEERLGRALCAAGEENIFISTKVGRLIEPASGSALDSDGFAVSGRRTLFDYSTAGIMRSLESSLSRLRCERIDTLYLHDIGRRTHGDLHAARLRQALQESLPQMARLKASGVCRAIGIAVNEEDVCLDVMSHFDLDCILLAGRYTLLEQGQSLRVLAEASRRGVSIQVGGPFNSGLLAHAAGPGATYDYRPVDPAILERAQRLYRICASQQVDVGAAALQFVLSHPAVSSVIAGMRSPAEVAQAAERLTTPIPSSLWDALRREGMLNAEAPSP